MTFSLSALSSVATSSTLVSIIIIIIIIRSEAASSLRLYPSSLSVALILTFCAAQKLTEHSTVWKNTVTKTKHSQILLVNTISLVPNKKYELELHLQLSRLVDRFSPLRKTTRRYWELQKKDNQQPWDKIYSSWTYFCNTSLSRLQSFFLKTALMAASDQVNK